MASAASATRYDIEKFDGFNDFGLWRINMKALMGNLGLKEALVPQKPFLDTVTAEQRLEVNNRRQEICEKAFNTLILSLGDKVLREVSKMETTKDLWAKLESLYMTKSLSSRLYLKAKFFTFKMQEGQKLQSKSFKIILMILTNCVLIWKT